MKNLLFVSIAFPPKSDAEGLQVAKYLKYICRESGGKFNIDAITSRQPTLNMSYDPSLESLSDGVRQIVELPIYENRYSNFLLRKVAPRVLQTPDSKFSFHLQANRAIRKLNHKPDLIYSRSFPASSAVMAYKLKIHYGVPWIMHLSDLWADCPESCYTGAAMEYQQRVEALCFQAADVVCVTSRKTLAFYEKKYGDSSAKLAFFPNVFDAEDAHSVPSQTDAKHGGKLRIVHTGSLAGDRSPEPFLRAIESLPAEVRGGLEVIFVGAMDSANRAIFEAFKIECVSWAGPVPYQTALEIQRSADILLLIDMPVIDPGRRVFFPSKILDYMIARHPILALVDEGSEVEDVIARYELGTCFRRHESAAIADHIQRVFSQRECGYFDSRELIMDFEAGVNAKRLVELFGEHLE